MWVQLYFSNISGGSLLFILNFLDVIIKKKQLDLNLKAVKKLLRQK